MPIKHIICFDAETLYDPKDGYTLRVQSPPEYILDKRFELIMCATCVNNGAQRIVDGPDFPRWLAQYDPAECMGVSFNALFDLSILAWRYGWVPALMADTMNMARALHGHELPDLKLKTVSKFLLDRTKGEAIHKVAGMGRDAIKANPALWREFGEYCTEDNEQNRQLFKLLYGKLPPEERRSMDLVIRAAVQPQFVLDKDKLTAHLDSLRTAKAKLVVDLMDDVQDRPGMIRQLADYPDAMKEAVKTSGIMSPVRYKAALEALGVVVEMKTSPATGKETPAFAKTDKFMAALREHPNFAVQALAEARLGCKSTLEETRCARLLRIASLDWPAIPGCPRGALMPIALRYAGAHTHRLSGDWGLNMQNLPRKSVLRECLLAPNGYTVVVADCAQIEARLVAWISKQFDLLDTFSRPGRKGDPYSAFATKIFGYEVNRKTFEIKPDGAKFFPHEVQGFVGKVGVLSLGYGCGDERFFIMVETSARLFAIPIDGSLGVLFDQALATKTVQTYRKDYSKIAQSWDILGQHVREIWSENGEARFGPCTITRGCIEGPGGLKMQYANPRWERRKMPNGSWAEGYWFDYGRFTHKMYGGMMLENIIQFLARIILMNIALRLFGQGYRFAQQAHDELGFVVPDEKVDEFKKLVYREFTTPPTWAADLPLDAEVGSGPSYGDAK